MDIINPNAYTTNSSSGKKRGRKPGRLITEAQMLKFAVLFLAIVLAEGGAIVATLLYVLLSE